MHPFRRAYVLTIFARFADLPVLDFLASRPTTDQQLSFKPGDALLLGGVIQC